MRRMSTILVILGPGRRSQHGWSLGCLCLDIVYKHAGDLELVRLIGKDRCFECRCPSSILSSWAHEAAHVAGWMAKTTHWGGR